MDNISKRVATGDGDGKWSRTWNSLHLLCLLDNVWYFSSWYLWASMTEMLQC